MNILLICAGGFSTSVLVKKVEKWSDEKGKNILIEAVGLGSYQDNWRNFDVVLIAPQISYRAEEIKKNVGIATANIPPAVYGIGDAETLYSIALEAIGKEEI